MPGSRVGAANAAGGAAAPAVPRPTPLMDTSTSAIRAARPRSRSAAERRNRAAKPIGPRHARLSFGFTTAESRSAARLRAM